MLSIRERITLKKQIFSTTTMFTSYVFLFDCFVYHSFLDNTFSYFKGSGKTHAFRQLEKAITKAEKMFASTYLKPVIVNGKPSDCDLSSVVTHTNHIGLRQHLASNHKILLNDDADLIAEMYGLYNVNDYSKEHERNIILCGYDG